MSEAPAITVVLCRVETPDGKARVFPLKDGSPHTQPIEAARGHGSIRMKVETMLAHPLLESQKANPIWKDFEGVLRMRGVGFVIDEKYPTTDKAMIVWDFRIDADGSVECGGKGDVAKRKYRPFKVDARKIKVKIPKLGDVVDLGSLAEFELSGEIRQEIEYKLDAGRKGVSLVVTGLLNGNPYLRERYSVALAVRTRRKSEPVPPKLKAKLVRKIVGPFMTGKADPWKMDPKARVRNGMNASRFKAYLLSLPASTRSIYENGDKLPNGKKVIVKGYADSRASEQRNQSLSRDRAQAVKALMQQSLGGPDGMYSVLAQGERKPNKDTEKGADEPENRVAEVEFYVFE